MVDRFIWKLNRSTGYTKTLFLSFDQFLFLVLLKNNNIFTEILIEFPLYLRSFKCRHQSNKLK